MTKKDEIVAEVAPETPAVASSTGEEEEEEDIDIEAGYLNKKGSNPLNPWNKRYFAFGTEPVALSNLQGLHKRNEHRVKATPSPAPASSKGKEPAKDTPAKESEAPAAAAAPAAATPAPTVAEVYEEANKDLLVNIAHATTKGEGLLFYHKSDDELHRQNPLGIINLRDVNAVSRVEKSSKNRSFVVSTKNRDYHFSAESPAKAKGWVKAIQEKADEAKTAKDPSESPEFQEVYKKLVAREAFEHAKNSAAIVSDADINSDGEPDDIEIEGGQPIVKKRKSFFAFGAVETSHVKTKEGGVTTEVSTEQHKDLTHVQEGDVDALKTHESSNAVAHTTDGTAPAAAPAAPAPKAKSGGFKLFGKKSPKTEEAPAPAPTEHPLTVDEAKAEALKAVDDAVEDSKAKAAAAKAEADHPPAPPAPEKKPSFLANLFHKKPAAPPAPVAIPNEETIVVSSENNLSDVVTAEGEATSQSSAGFFSRLSKGKDKNEVEVKSSEVATEDVITAEGSTHVEHVEGTDANVIKSDGENVVDLSTTDETVATADKAVEHKPSLLKRLGDAVRPAKAADEVASATAKETVAEEPAAEAEAAVEDTKVAEVIEVEVEVEATA